LRTEPITVSGSSSCLVVSAERNFKLGVGGCCVFWFHVGGGFGEDGSATDAEPMSSSLKSENAD
jgi:hypothetical protein